MPQQQLEDEQQPHVEDEQQEQLEGEPKRQQLEDEQQVGADHAVIKNLEQDIKSLKKAIRTMSNNSRCICFLTNQEAKETFDFLYGEN